MADIEKVIDRLSEGVELLRKNLQCSICLEVLNNPVRTRCCHTFCQECIMQVVNNIRIAYCPLCTKSINRRGILENGGIALLVKKVQNVIEGIGKDTGFDITAHVKLPTSTREAYLASPKYLKKKDVISIQSVDPSQQFVKPTIPTSKEQWLNRYKKQYSAKCSTDEDAELLSISQIESVIPSYMPPNKKLQALKCKVDEAKIPPVAKVQEWLQKNDAEFDEADDTPTPESQRQTNTMTVTADVHKTIDDNHDLLSVSQQNYYIAPRKVDKDALKFLSEEVETQPSLKRKIFTAKNVDDDKIILEKSIIEIAKESTEQDPYEFISSQKTYKTTKKKRKSKNKINKKTSIKRNQPSLNRCDIKNKDLNKLDLNRVESPIESQSQTFIYSVDVNDTFDKLVLNTRKSEQNNNMPEKQVSKEIVNEKGVEDDNNIQLFGTPLECAIIYQKHDESTTESMSDADFSSGSDEDWGETNKVEPEVLVISGKRTRRSSRNKEPSKKLDIEGSMKRRTQSSSRQQEKETETKKSQAVEDILKEAKKPEVSVEKNTPLSPSKQLNSKEGKLKQTLNISKLECRNTLGKELSRTDKENLAESGNGLAVNITTSSYSPGWSRITQTKKEFEKFKKPAIKALNVSGGGVCVTKKHARNEATKIMEPTCTVISSVPAIDEVDRNVNVSSTVPVVAFDSPEAVKRVQVMSKIVRDLENQIKPLASSKLAVEPSDRDESALGIKMLQRCQSSDSTFSQLTGIEDSPASNKRKELINTIVSTLSEEEKLATEGNNIEVMNTEDRLIKVISCTQTSLDVLNSKDVTVVPESNSLVNHEEVVESLKNSSENQITLELIESTGAEIKSIESSKIFPSKAQVTASDLGINVNPQEVNDPIHKSDCSVFYSEAPVNSKDNSATCMDVASSERKEQKDNSICGNEPQTVKVCSRVDVQMRDNSSTAYVPFLKCGILKRKIRHSNVIFLRLGKLAQCTYDPYIECLQERRQITNINCEVQTSPQLCNVCNVGIQANPVLSNVGNADAEAMLTSITNTIPVQNADSQIQTENFVPDSCENIYVYESCIPLPHHRSALRPPPRHSQVTSPVCQVAKTLSIEKDRSSTEENDLNEAVVLKTQSSYDELLGEQFNKIPFSQISMATTVKFKKCNSPGGSALTSSESVPQSSTSVSVSLLQNSDSQLINSDGNIEAVVDCDKSENRDSNNEKCTKIKKIEKFVSDEVMLVDEEPELEKDSNESGKIENKRRSSKASRQLKFSSRDIPKLTEPSVDKITTEVLLKKDMKDSSSTYCSSASSVKSVESYVQNTDTVNGDKKRREEKRKSYKRIRIASDSSDSEFSDNKIKNKSNSEFGVAKKPRCIFKETTKSENQNIEVTDEEIIDLLSPTEDASEDIVSSTFKKDKFEKWLNEDVPSSDTLLERVMANIDADLAETRKRKLTEKTSEIERDVERGSPTLFTSPSAAQQPEDVNQATWELVVSQPEMQSKKNLLTETSRGTTTGETESENTQQVQAGIRTLEVEIKECQEALEEIETKELNTRCSKAASVESDSESEDDFIEPTPRKDVITNTSRESRSRGKSNEESEIVMDTETKHVVQLVENVKINKSLAPSKSPAAVKDSEILSRQSKTVKSPGSSGNSHSTLPTTPKQFVLRPPSISTLSTNAGERMFKPVVMETAALPPSKLCFVCSGLPMGLIARVKALARNLGAEFSNKFEPHTTHLVVKASDDMMADKTYKYLCAVVRRKWIISISWVNACLQANKLLPEDEYEMLDSSGENGPNRSRTSSDPLFKNFEFCSIGPFTDLSKDQLEDMLRECGAATVSNPEQFTFKPGHHSLILVQMAAEREEERREWWEKYGVLPVGHEWVFECIGRYRIVPFWSFLLCNINEDHIRALGYPEDAVASDDESEVTLT